MRTHSKPHSKQRAKVRALAAQGLNSEVIAATIGISRNTLRSRHALDLHAGRQIKAAAKAAAPRTKQERARGVDSADRALVSQPLERPSAAISYTVARAPLPKRLNGSTARAVSSVTAQTVTDPEIASADSSRAGRPRRSARLPRAPLAAALFDRRRAHTSCRLATSAYAHSR